MSNANPLIPQGSLLEQKAKSRPHLRIAIFIVAIHLVFLGGLLMQGCKREDQTAGNNATNETALPPLDTNALYGTNLPLGTGAVAQLPETTNYVAPVLTPTPTPAPPAGAQEYTVARGDSFYSIGKKFGVSANAIAKANPGVDSTRLKVGQKLQIPAAANATASTGTRDALSAAGTASETYTVKAGDTLTRIARAHGTTATALRDLNGLSTDRINVGQKLKLPAKAAPAETTATAAVPSTVFVPAPTNAATPAPGPGGTTRPR